MFVLLLLTLFNISSNFIQVVVDFKISFLKAIKCSTVVCVCVCVFIYTKLAGKQLKEILRVGTFSYFFMVAFGATGRGLGRELKF